MAAPEKLSDIVTSFLDVVHDRLISDTRGTVADYIPQLAEADPELFGIALCGLNGHVYESGRHRGGVHDPIRVEAVLSIRSPSTTGGSMPSTAG